MDWKQKLTSRKFWAAVSAFAANLIIFLHGTEETAVQVTSLIMAGAAVVAYIVGEGLIDAAGASSPVISLPVNWEEEKPPEEPDEEEVPFDEPLKD